jgi:hypothetical protein
MTEAQQQQQQQQRVASSDPMDYARFVLYVKRGPVACEQVVRLASTRQEVIIQDVDTIKGPKPPWLRGVPTLVELPDYRLHTGTSAIEALRAYIAREIDGVGIAAVKTVAVGAPLVEDTSEPGVPWPSSSQLFDDPRYEDAPTEKRGGSIDLKLEEMLRRRSAAAA